MSIIYSIECYECGAELTYSLKMDSDEDLFMKVSPCESCMEEKKAEGYEEGKKDAE